jgi:hypothetical protein
MPLKAPSDRVGSFTGNKDMRYKTVKSIEYSKKLNKEESDMLMYMLGRIHGEFGNCNTSCPLRKGISKKKINIIPIHSDNPEDTARQIQNFLEKSKHHKDISYIG